MIYERIKSMCEKEGIPVSALEKRLKLGNQTIVGWKTAQPRVDKLQRVADYFNVSLDYLVKGENAK